MDLGAWARLGRTDRAAWLAEAAARLGAPWQPGLTAVGRHGLGELVHGELGLRFVVIPGGWLRMGFSVDDLLAASAARGEPARIAWNIEIARARPTRWVRIRPFLLAVDGLPPAGEGPATDGGRAAAAYLAAVRGEPVDVDGAEEPPMREVDPATAAALVPPGLRLPSEAELEWALREAGTTRWIGLAADQPLTAANRWAALGALRSGFGLRGIANLASLCADGWTDDHVGAPADATPRNPAGAQRVARSAHTYWQDDDAEMIALHPANRFVPDPYGSSIVRLAADLPADLPGVDDAPAPPAALAEHAATLAALRAGDDRARADALAALACVARGPGDDLGPTAEAVIAALADVPADARAALLRWLADAQTGGHVRETVEPPARLAPARLPADRAAVRAAVAAAPAAIGACLDDADPDVRGAAALAWTFCPDAGAPARAALEARLGREAEPGVRAALILALARLGADVGGRGDDAVTRAAVAIGAAFDAAPRVDELVAAGDLGDVPHLPFADGRLGDVAVGILARLEPAARQRGAVALARRAAVAGDPALGSFALELAFGPAPPGDPPVPVDAAVVTPAQREVVSALTAGGVAAAWYEHGLPPGRLARRRWLGDAPPAAHDRAGHLLRTALAAKDVVARDAALAPLDPVVRLTLFLERVELGLDQRHRIGAASVGGLPAEWRVDRLLAEARATDPAATRAIVDGMLHGFIDAEITHALDVVRAVVATRAPGEAPPAAALALIGDGQLAHAADVLAAFDRTDVEARLLAALAPLVAGALASDGWSIGVDQRATPLAALLAGCPSAAVARHLLVLGWAAGQPAAMREAVGRAGDADPAIAAVLAAYDSLPAGLTGWPAARAALRALWPPT